tara:strand:+ start:693 stop:1130 length:438 start_codon:yes stop_codon:yes gene_type:complete
MMIKNFTLDDIQEITDACEITGVDQVWCRILFKDCENPHEFCATQMSTNEFSQNLYAKFKSGEYGSIVFGTGLYRTQPAEQEVVEETIIAKRNQLLLESDYTEFTSTQAKLSEDQKVAWVDYRQALRDLPASSRFPWDPVWPTKP